MCDRDGYVYGSRPGIERLANIQWKFDNDDDVDPWLVLMSPDPNSSDTIRAPENEGRRIEEVSGGFRLLNFEYYRGLRNDDDRREQNRRAQEKFRSKSTSASVSHDKPKSAGESRRNPPSAASKPISEAEAEAEAEGTNKHSGNLPTLEQAKERAKFVGVPEADAEQFWHHFNSMGWVDKNGHAIKNWESKLMTWKNSNQQANYERNQGIGRSSDGKSVAGKAKGTPVKGF